MPEKDPRAMELGTWLQDVRRQRGLTRPETIAEINKHDPRATISTDYLAKIEYGQRSLASTSTHVREALRRALNISREQWEQSTGLLIPAEPDTAPPPQQPSHAQRRGWVIPDEDPEPEIPEALQEAADRYGHGPNAPLSEPRWLRELADLDFREEPETPEDWLAVYARLSKIINPK